MPQVVVRVTDDQLAWLEGQVQQFRPKSVVVRDLIDSAMQGVDKPVTLTERAPASAGEEGGSVVSTSTSIKESTLNRSNKKTTQKKKDEFSFKHLPESIQVPNAIVDCDELLREFLVC